MQLNIKRLGFLAGLFLTASSAFAQVGEPRSRLAIGINGGINLNTMNFTPTIKQKNFQGLNGGLTLRYTCEKYFSTLCALQLEANYSQRGWYEKTDDVDNTYKRTINYVEIPFLVHLGWGKEQKGLQFFLNAGPQMNFYLSDKEEEGGDWDNSTSRPNNVTEQYGKAVDNKFDYGITAGLGMELNSKAGHFLVEGRYYFGFGNFFGATKKDYFGISAHRCIVIKAVYLFDITK